MHIKEMNEGVQILLARMKTHPEEFVNGDKWRFVHESIKQERLSFLFPEEIDALDKGLKETYREKFTAMVLKRLTKDEQGELF